MPADNPATSAGTHPPARSTDPDAALRFLRFIFDGATGYAEFRFFGRGRKTKVAGPSRYLELPPGKSCLPLSQLFHDPLETVQRQKKRRLVGPLQLIEYAHDGPHTIKIKLPHARGGRAVAVIDVGADDGAHPQQPQLRRHYRTDLPQHRG